MRSSPFINAAVTILIWPIALGALGFALARFGGPAVSHPFAAALAQFGLAIGLVHFAVASALRRRRDRRSIKTSPSQN